MRRAVGLSLGGLFGLLTVLLSGGEAQAFGPHLVRSHGTWLHHHAAPATPVQPLSAGQIITGIGIAQDIIDAIRKGRLGDGADQKPAEPVVSQEVFNSLARNKTVLEKAVTGTNALTALVAKGDKRYEGKFEKIEHKEGTGATGGTGVKESPAKNQKDSTGKTPPPDM